MGEVSEGRIMSVFRQKNALSSAVLEGFRGIDTRKSRNSLPFASDMVNFKLCEDGSLEKRCGFLPIASFSSSIRAVWSGKLGGCERVFVVYSNYVASVDPISLSVSTIGIIKSYDGHANFIFFDSNLYIKDSFGFYLVTFDNVRAVEGYAPLYGKDWVSATAGEVNEPLNLISRRIRMNYTVTEPNIFLRVDHMIATIDAVYVNGVLRTDPTTYYFKSSFMCVCVLNIEVGDKVELYLTLENSEIANAAAKLLECQNAFVYGGSSSSRFFLWGSSQGDVIYGSSDIDDSSFENSKKVYSDSMPLYVKQNDAFTMGREKKEISAVCRHYDRMLIFTQDDTWTVKEPARNGEPLEAIAVNSTYGSTSPCGALMLGNDPISISDGAILKWTADTDELNECNAYSISEEIEGKLGATFFENAVIFADKKRNELYFSDPNDEAGTLWIYAPKTKNWYKYDGIGAEAFLEINERIAFTRENTLYIFDPSKDTDILPNGEERTITAYFESLPQDFDSSENKKRLCGMTLDAHMEDSTLLMEYISEGKVIASLYTKADGECDKHEKRRLNSGRFNCAALKLTSSGKGRIKIYSTGMWIKP